jgi:uncharacterized paraquat-inducible protein A
MFDVHVLVTIGLAAIVIGLCLVAYFVHHFHVEQEQEKNQVPKCPECGKKDAVVWTEEKKEWDCYRCCDSFKEGVSSE